MKACPNGHPNVDDARYCRECEFVTDKKISQKKMFAITSISLLVLLVLAFAFYLFYKPKQQIAAKPKYKILLMKLVVSSAIDEELAPALVKSYLESEFHATNLQIDKHFYDAQAKINLTTVSGNKSKDTLVEVKIASQNLLAAAESTDDYRPYLNVALRKIVKKGKTQVEGDSLSSEFAIGMEGVAVIVNEKNPLKEISLCDLSKIYATEIHDWNELSDYKGNIQLLGMENTSPTMKFFEEVVMANKNCTNTISESFKVLNSTLDIYNKVAATDVAIGFGSSEQFGDKVTKLAIFDGGTRHLKPTPFNICSGDYLLIRQLYLFHPVNQSDRAITNFIDYCLSDNGQKAIEDNKYVPLSISKDCNYEIQGAAGDYKTRIVAQNCRLSVTIYYKTGKEDVDDEAQRTFERVATYLSRDEFKNKTISICGFTDNVGSEATNNKLAKTRAEKVKSYLSQLCKQPIETYGFGKTSPVGDNSADEGREKNRRAEIWISK